MNIEEIFEELNRKYELVRSKKCYNEYTMGACERIAQDSKKMIMPLRNHKNYSEQVEEALKYFDEAINLSIDYHNRKKWNDCSSVMNVIRPTQNGLGTILNRYN